MRVTASPGEVGIVRQPPLWMKTGDVVRVEIEALGALCHRIVEEPDDTAAW
jgi:2-keto-4-pentenoate hydratase/2-oxohepta-3-ene-1,7-dioic acid hydratase in catechol pathway